MAIPGATPAGVTYQIQGGVTLLRDRCRGREIGPFAFPVVARFARTTGYHTSRLRRRAYSDSRSSAVQRAKRNQPTTDNARAARNSATIPPRGASNRRTYIMRFDLRDVALRTLILVAGGVAAVLLALKGQGQALPALAVGGTLGACVMARFGPSEH